MKRWLYALPVAALVVVAGLGGWQMMRPSKGDFERISRAAPEHVFPLMDGSGEIAFAPPPGGQPVVVNLFASWCAPCEAEHKYLVALGEQHPGQVYGILYKDKVEDGAGFLQRLGNPYTQIGLDPEGRGGLDFGLTGVPETFVISASGEIILHIGGPLDETLAQKASGALEAPRP